MKNNIQKFKEDIKKELEAYNTLTKPKKPYFTSMKEISSWLDKKDI